MWREKDIGQELLNKDTSNIDRNIKSAYLKIKSTRLHWQASSLSFKNEGNILEKKENIIIAKTREFKTDLCLTKPWFPPLRISLNFYIERK